LIERERYWEMKQMNEGVRKSREKKRENADEDLTKGGGLAGKRRILNEHDTSVDGRQPEKKCRSLG